MRPTTAILATGSGPSVPTTSGTTYAGACTAPPDAARDLRGGSSTRSTTVADASSAVDVS